MANLRIADPPREQLLDLVALHGEGRFDEAYERGTELAKRFPASPSLSNILGVISIHAGRSVDARLHLQQALKLKPDFHDVRANLGTMLLEAGDVGEARSVFEAGVALAPEHAALLAGLGNVEAACNNPAAAIDLYRRAIVANPKAADVYNALGHIFAQQGMNSEALAIFRTATQIKPDFGEAYASMAGVLRGIGELEAALAAFEKAAELAPNSAAVQLNKAVFHASTSDAERAAAAFDRVMELDPENLNAWASGLYYQAMLCRWDERRNERMERLRQAEFAAKPKQLPGPFVMMTLFDDPGLQMRAAENRMAELAAAAPRVDAFVPPAPGLKIRLGYFSADFHNHATMHLMARLFELHDRSRFEVHAFSFAEDHGGGGYRQRLLDNVDHFYDVGAKSDAEVVALARGVGIDIAVDLKGHTRDSRAAIFLSRVAPIQVNYLGYPGTGGGDAWDYIIADRVIVPPAYEAFYSEKLIALPGSYQVNDDRRPISDRAFSRAECGLPEEGFVFCCFNSAYKITPSEFNIWMRLLKSVEGSVLWLLKATDTTAVNLRAEAAARGVEPDRLVFAEHMPLAEHLARQQLADLFLDTFVVNAHTTASDALWAGLPVLTMAGQSFAARVSASLLFAVGLDDLVTETPEAYEQLAKRLALDEAALSACKARLAVDRSRLSLFDTRKYAQNLETAYQTAFERYRNDEPFGNIEI